MAVNRCWCAGFAAPVTQRVERGLTWCPVPVAETFGGVRVAATRAAVAESLGGPSGLRVPLRFGIPQRPAGGQGIERAEQGGLVPLVRAGQFLQEAQCGVEADQPVELYARAQRRHPAPVRQRRVAHLAGVRAEAHARQARQVMRRDGR